MHMSKIESLLAQAGLNRNDPTGALSTPIYQTSTFRHPAIGQSTGFDYSRSSNPTRLILEQTIAALEQGDRGFAFASGMAALTAVLTLFKPGEHFIVSDDLYGGTYRLFEEIFSRFGITTSYVDCSDTAKIEEALRPETKAVLIETPTNPLMKIADLRKISVIAEKSGLLFIVDNTFMTPFFQRPLELGADIVIHSGTKFLSGHNDVVCGFVVTKSCDLSGRIGFIQNATGGILSPSDSWLVIRGLKTLALRMERTQSNAQQLALWIKDQTTVLDVLYPGLADHPSRLTHMSQASGFGSMLSFRVKDKALVGKTIHGVELISFAESLGGCETLITYPALQTHGAIPGDIREKIGVTDDLIRISVGIEHIDDLITDLDRALNG
jgi:cystathionine beta-lyase/cystathionine gamma-synthase